MGYIRDRILMCKRLCKTILHGVEKKDSKRKLYIKEKTYVNFSSFVIVSLFILDFNVNNQVTLSSRRY